MSTHSSVSQVREPAHHRQPVLDRGECGRRYQLGAPIELAELLALPPDDHWYTRTEHGRLALLSPDHQRLHGRPITRITARLNKMLDLPVEVAQERAIAFPKIYNLDGELIRESFLGPKALVPDVTVFVAEPEMVTGPHDGDWYAAEHIGLVIEVLSPGTWREDLGHGSADKVDRYRSFFESGVPEYWILNPAVEHCPVQISSGLFLVRGRTGWEEQPREQATPIVRCRAVPGLELDLESFW